MLGVHVAKTSKILDPPNKVRKTMNEAIRVECEVLALNCAQIFTHGPRGHKKNNMDYEKIKKLSQEIHISVHSSYPTVAIWNLTEANKDEGKSRRIISHIRDQLISCKKIGALGLVVHISRKPVEVILEAMQVVQHLMEETKVPILLEMISSKAHPDLTYESPKKINKLVKTLQPLESKTWGICVDTAHVWGSGLDISSKKLQDKWFKDLTKEATKKIRMFHLNGSESDLGSGKDKHAIAFTSDDKIYKKYKKTPDNSGLYSVIKFCKSRNLPVILEINRGSEKDAISLIDIISDIEEN
jgi:endonuclease IV